MVINEKVAYLKGIIDTANIKNDTPEGRLMIEIVNALDLIACELNDQSEQLEELDSYIEEIDSDLGEVEAVLYDEDDCCCGDDCDCDYEYDDCDCDCCDCDEADTEERHD